MQFNFPATDPWCWPSPILPWQPWHVGILAPSIDLVNKGLSWTVLEEGRVSDKDRTRLEQYFKASTKFPQLLDFGDPNGVIAPTEGPEVSERSSLVKVMGRLGPGGPHSSLCVPPSPVRLKIT